MVKLRIRTRGGEYRDDLNHFTEKWQEVETDRDYESIAELEVKSLEKPAKEEPAAEEGEDK